MAEESVHTSRATRSRKAIASYLRRAANALDGGAPVPVGEAEEVAVDLPARPEFEVDLEREDDRLNLELEVEWDEEGDEIDTDPDGSDATFELYRDNADEWRWRLRHRNGNIIADGGEGYTNKADAENGIDSVKQNAPGAAVEEQAESEESDGGEGDPGSSDATFELYRDSADEWRWRLRHRNGNIIADGGEGYVNKADAENGIDSVKQNAPGAAVEEE
jgi:amphi-Trp domain-containing protein